jgi:Holliday junction resolvase RusA-like endonuclease
VIKAVIQGQPDTVTAQQKGVMVRGGRVMFYTKKKVQDAKDKLTAALRRHAPRKPIDWPVLVTIRFWFAPVKARPLEKTHGVRPDVDNLAKGVLDCLVPAGWLKDDALIDQLIVTKARSGDARLEVELKDLLK